MDLFDLQAETPATENENSLVTIETETSSVTAEESQALTEEFSEAGPAMDTAEEPVISLSAADAAIEAMKELTKVLRSKAKVVDQIAEKTAQLENLTDELRGMLNGDIDETEERDEYAVAVERKKTETDIQRLQKRADPAEIKASVNDTMDALTAYLDEL